MISAEEKRESFLIGKEWRNQVIRKTIVRLSDKKNTVTDTVYSELNYCRLKMVTKALLFVALFSAT